jgi:hypothetical protein
MVRNRIISKKEVGGGGGDKEKKKKTYQNQIQRKQIEQTKEKPPENHTTVDI